MPGFWELVIIGVVAFLVLGPDQLPGVARTAGRWVRTARRLSNEFMNALEEAADLEDERKKRRAAEAEAEARAREAATLREQAAGHSAANPAPPAAPHTAPSDSTPVLKRPAEAVAQKAVEPPAGGGAGT